MKNNNSKFLEKLSDENLMQEVAGGNLDVLRILFDRHHRHIFNFLYKISGDKFLSEDITQEVFYKVIKYRATYDNGKFLSWIFTIARNSLSTHYLRNKETHKSLDTVDHKYCAEEEGNDEDYSRLQLALNKLETSDKELLVLHRFQKMKYKEMAEITGSTPGAMKTKVSRALKKLKKIYFENI